MNDNEPYAWIELATLTRNVIEFLQRREAPTEPGAGLGLVGAIAQGEDTDPGATELVDSSRMRKVQ